MTQESRQPRGLSTRCVHAGEALDAQGGIHTPLYYHST
jgi:cystathionine gamma-synthase